MGEEPQVKGHWLMRIRNSSPEKWVVLDDFWSHGEQSHYSDPSVSLDRGCFILHWKNGRQIYYPLSSVIEASYEPTGGEEANGDRD